MPVQHRVTLKEDLNLEAAIGAIAYKYSTRAGSDYNEAFGTPMPSQMNTWLMGWLKNEIPKMLDEHDEKKRKADNTFRKRVLRASKGIALFLAGAVVTFLITLALEYYFGSILAKLLGWAY